MMGKPPAGMTLVEVLVALLVTSLLLIAALEGLQFSARSATRLTQSAKASACAQSKLIEMQHGPAIHDAHGPCFNSALQWRSTLKPWPLHPHWAELSITVSETNLRQRLAQRHALRHVGASK